jgi:hypothetical protein
MEITKRKGIKRKTLKALISQKTRDASCYSRILSHFRNDDFGQPKANPNAKATLFLNRTSFLGNYSLKIIA